jgi:hypothetical protein
MDRSEINAQPERGETKIKLALRGWPKRSHRPAETMISENWRNGDGLLSLDRISPRQALAMLSALGLLVAFGLTLALSAGPPTPRPGGGADARLYEAVIRDVAQGVPYAAAAAREHRVARAPLRPFLTVRPPLLAESLAALPNAGFRAGVLDVLAAATFVAWAWRLRALRREPVRYTWALALLAGGICVGLGGGAYLFHEVWAGLLIALSLALRTPRNWAPSVAVGLLAALMRELAFPFLAAMAFVALLERRRLEAAAWSGALLLAGLALAAHAAAVARVVTTSDLASPGWTSFSGWAFILHLAEFNGFLLNAPFWLPAILVPATLLGLLFWTEGEGGFGRRVGFVALGYILAFCVVGRADNDYWGLLLSPLLPLGLIRLDRVAASLVAACRSGFRRPAAAGRS